MGNNCCVPRPGRECDLCKERFKWPHEQEHLIPRGLWDCDGCQADLRNGYTRVQIAEKHEMRRQQERAQRHQQNMMRQQQYHQEDLQRRQLNAQLHAQNNQICHEERMHHRPQHTVHTYNVNCNVKSPRQARPDTTYGCTTTVQSITTGDIRCDSCRNRTVQCFSCRNAQNRSTTAGAGRAVW